jgi:hypothetical protein
MYTKEEASKVRQAFWTAFGQYIAPQPSADGLKVNWVNYKTGIKHVYFKMHADKDMAYIAIEMAHPDPEIQEMFFQQFEAQKDLLHAILEEEWNWALHSTDEYGKTISRIYKELAPVNIFNEQDWPKLISFLKPRITALDEFWSNAKYGFEELK